MVGLAHVFAFVVWSVPIMLASVALKVSNMPLQLMRGVVDLYFVVRTGFHKLSVACLRLVTALNCVCLLIQICCNTTRCGLQRERGTTTSVLLLLTLCVSQVEQPPIKSALDSLPLTAET